MKGNQTRRGTPFQPVQCLAPCWLRHPDDLSDRILRPRERRRVASDLLDAPDGDGSCHSPCTPRTRRIEQSTAADLSPSHPDAHPGIEFLPRDPGQDLRFSQPDRVSARRNVHKCLSRCVPPRASWPTPMTSQRYGTARPCLAHEVALRTSLWDPASAEAYLSPDDGASTFRLPLHAWTLSLDHE